MALVVAHEGRGYTSSPARDWNAAECSLTPTTAPPRTPSKPMGQRSSLSASAPIDSECLGHTTSQRANCEGRRRLGGKACASRLLAWKREHPTDTDTLAQRVCGGGYTGAPDSRAGSTYGVQRSLHVACN